MRIAAIMCSFNRKEYTKRCISQLIRSAERIRDCELTIYICDDGSADGTPQEIRSLYPKVRLLQSKGNLYWCKSMHLAMKKAVEEDHDFYLMVNDDVDFRENAIEVMLASYEAAQTVCGIVGSTKAVNGEQCTYGGRDRAEVLVIPNGRLQKCQWANWNCFLAGREVIQRIGIIDGKYQHAWGDYDYSYRMEKAGVPLYVAADYIGRCDKNPKTGTYRDHTLPRKERLKKFFSPKGMPFYSYMRYHIIKCKDGHVVKYLLGYLSMIGYIVAGKELK